MNNDTEKGRAGELFEDFLAEQDTFEETTERAVKRVLDFQLNAAKEQPPISTVETRNA